MGFDLIAGHPLVDVGIDAIDYGPATWKDPVRFWGGRRINSGVEALPTFELDRARGRFRTYLWKLTHNTMIDWVRRGKVRNQAEKEWVRLFCEVNEAKSRELKGIFLKRHRQRILEVVLPQVRAIVSPTAWACFKGRLVRGLPAATVATELGISANEVFVYAWRVLKEVRRRCAELEEGLDHGSDPGLSGRV
jgi:DNA-directed RNA polymerase specialized sigma24 family protein